VATNWSVATFWSIYPTLRIDWRKIWDEFAWQDHRSRSYRRVLFCRGRQDSISDGYFGHCYSTQTQNLAIANRSRISCANNTSRASIVTLLYLKS